VLGHDQLRTGQRCCWPAGV